MIERRLTIRSKLRYEDGREETLEHQATGAYVFRDGTHHFRYREEDREADTVLSIQEETVKIRRFGSSGSTMTIAVGETHQNTYRTPYGALEMETEGHRVSLLVDEQGRGQLTLAYRLTIDGDVTSENEIRLTVR